MFTFCVNFIFIDSCDHAKAGAVACQINKKLVNESLKSDVAYDITLVLLRRIGRSNKQGVRLA